MKNPSLYFVLVVCILISSIVLFHAPKPAQNITEGDPSSGWYGRKGDIASERKNRIKGHMAFDAPDKFAEYHRAIRTRDGEDGPAYGPNYRIDALLKARQWTSSASFGKHVVQDPLPWIERGPGNVAGRARIILIDPDDETDQTWFVGSASGGVWKTTDAGQTWREMTIGIPNLATTTLAMPAVDPNIIYMGTGEGFGTFAFVYGQGLWKSTDKGETWTQLASTAGDVRFTNTMRLIVDPNDANNLVAATSTGARNQTGESSYIFRSTDGGVSWTETYMSTVSGSAGRVEHVIASPDDFNVQYASVNTSGVLKSTDGGSTWTEVFSVEEAPELIERMELAIAPTDVSRIYIATEGGVPSGAGLFVSTDAGATWIETAEVNENDLNWLGGQGWYDNTIAVHPYDANIVYTGGIDLMEIKLNATPTATRRIRLDVSEAEGLFTTVLDETGPDFAASLFETTQVFPVDLVPIEIRFGPGISQKAHRFTFSFATFTLDYQDYVDVPFQVWDIQNDRQLMVAFEDADLSGGWNPSDLLNFGRQETTMLIGVNYNETIPHAPTVQNPYIRALHAFALAARPDAIDLDALPEMTLNLLLEDIDLFSTTITPVTDGYSQYGGSAKGVHVDHHYILLHPTNPATEDYLFLNANDGGIAFSEDQGETFTQSGETFAQLIDGGNTTNTPLRGLNTTQFYGADKMNGGDRYVGGTQDNGSWVSPMDADVESTWLQAPSGDGFEAAWHYTEPDWIIESSQFNNFFRSLDGGATWEGLNTPGFGPFLTRLAKSNQDPDLIFAVNQSGVLRSENFGTSWTQIDLPDWGFNSVSSVVRISRASADVVWAASAMSTSQTPYVSEDGGLTFRKTNIYTEAGLGRLTEIATHPTDPNTAYAIFSFAGAPKILRTTDLGDTWEDISGFEDRATSNNGFPDVATYSLVVMPYDTNVMWAGTEVGLFISTDGGQNWAFADNGFPAVAIFQMRIVNDQVVVATHGRGIWSVALTELANYEPLPFALRPIIETIEGGIGGNVSVAISLRQAYDSTLVLFDGEITQRIGPNTGRAVETVQEMIPVSDIRNLEVQAISYADGETLASTPQTIDITPSFAAQSTYVNDFDMVNTELYLNGFSQFTPRRFPDRALHTRHPYENSTDVTALLLVPIIVAEENAILSYDDIAIVETGEPGAVFGNRGFYDYVVVEGSSDGGRTWTPLADGYDASYDEQWLTAYDEGEVGTPDMFVSHQVDLLNTFAAGDEILIRFRLFADFSVTGWGWAIDNLRIQDPTATSLAEVDGIPKAFNLHANYPNPFNPTTTITYDLPQSTDVEIAIYDVSGRMVRTLMAQQQQTAGTYEITWDGRSSAGITVASGVYLYRMTTGTGFSDTRRMVLIK